MARKKAGDGTTMPTRKPDLTFEKAPRRKSPADR